MMITNSVQNQTSKKYRIQYNKSPYNKMEKNDDYDAILLLHIYIDINHWLNIGTYFPLL